MPASVNKFEIISSSFIFWVYVNWAYFFVLNVGRIHPLNLPVFFVEMSMTLNLKDRPIQISSGMCV